MTPPKKNPLPFDPAWLALGLAALVLIGTAVWLIAVRTPPGPVAEATQGSVAEATQGSVVAAPQGSVAGTAQAPVAGLSSAPAADALAERLSAAEASLARLGAAPAATPQGVAELVEGRITALGQALEARFGAVEARDAELARAVSELQLQVQRGGAAMEQASRAVAERIGQMDQASGETRAAIDALRQQVIAGDQQRAATDAAQREFGAQVAARIAAIEQAGQAQQAATEALQRALVAAEAARQQQIAAAVEAARQQQTAAVEAVRQQQTAAVEAARQQQTAAIEAVRQQQGAAAQAQEAALAALSQRVAPLEQAAQRLAQAQARNERLVAIEALRTQLDAGRPLGTTLPRLGAEVPPALARFAEANPPTEAALRLAFEEAMRNARGTATPEGALNRLSSVLTIRRGEEVVWGDASEATVERARRALDAGDLDGALAQLARLPDATKQAIRPWLNDAEALAAARAALRQLAGA